MLRSRRATARRRSPRVADGTVTATALVPVLALCLALAPVVPRAVRADESGAELAETAGAGPSFTVRPRWELGVGGGYFAGNDYPASDDPNRRSLALPFFIYRGPVVRVGGGGVRARAIEQPRLRLDLSLGGSLSASAEADGPRAGMPDLDYLFEFGPQLELSLIDRPVAGGGRLQLEASAEFRAVAATDFADALRAEGFVAELGASLARRRVAGSDFDLFVGLDATFADERLQDYLYEVAPRFATPSRTAFDARGGYLGTELFIGAAWRPTSRLRVYAGLQSGLYAGAANADSPLFETTRGDGAALGFAWTLARSEGTIEVIERD